MRIVLLDYPPYGPWDVEARAAEAAGASFAVRTYEDFVTEPGGVELVLNPGAWPFCAELLARLPACRHVVGYGVGLDWIERAAAARGGIAVVHMPHANVEDVATHALALILACARRLLELDRAVRSGAFDWPRSQPFHRLRGRRLGLLAFGRIPRLLAPMVAPLGLHVSAYDPYVSPDEMRARGVQPMDADELLCSSQIVSVHLPSAPETQGFLDERRIALLPAGAIVVATSRGDVYDPSALVRALEEGRIAAAGLDVFPEEPLPAGHPLTQLPNVILTPHVAGYSEESIRDAHETAAAVIASVAAGEPPPGLVSTELLA
jgi:D-3-phosphoglycerate dehydrogenase